ncbi:alpha/beta fold hydrolase [Blastococcus sp. CT_GayMR16]|uniref:lipase family alpha/beta hydrolase n=1 Tax=Blastococcus sp. CT_GayMR16 TaxID=2559607 RepID=UPI001074033E|nr:alpha/beta fold hydrolase [Blastococcus sp. CT_GayMR16]TFV88212.1 alpha/beta fold hydrolase [Blastococcus sp. CT_GayMR16]
MRDSGGSGSGPESHTEPRPEAAPRGGLRGLCSASTLTGGLTELAWVGAHVLMYPLGTRTAVLRPDPRHRPGVQPATVRALFASDPLAARIPVLLVHGLVDNRSVFSVMNRSLRRRGFAQVGTWNYSPLLTDVARGAADLGAHIDRICEQTGHDRVHVVGHSLGGLIARYYVQRQGGDRRVESLVTLGTPHHGSVWAHVVPTPLIRQLRPGSPVIQKLDEPAPGCRTPVTAIYSDLDQVVVPTSSGRCDHPDLQARNVLFRGIGHMSLPRHRGVVDEVAATLAGVRGIADAPASRSAVA